MRCTTREAGKSQSGLFKRLKQEQAERGNEKTTRALKFLASECWLNDELEEIVFFIARHPGFKELASAENFPEPVINQVLDLAEAYYRLLWSVSSKDERMVLFHAAATPQTGYGLHRGARGRSTGAGQAALPAGSDPPGKRHQRIDTGNERINMSISNDDWTPFRPNSGELESIAQDVSEIGIIQNKLAARHKDLQMCDRVAHQYQIAGGKAVFKAASDLPADIQGVGLFQAGSEHTGVGRVSTGLGTPHIETNPDFLGLMLAFQTRDGQRVDFLAINAPTAPTDNHKEFMDVLHATAESAGAEFSHIGSWGDYNVGNLIAEQKEFGKGLKDRMGWLKAGRTLGHIVKQTLRTFRSSTAYQSYWTGILEINGKAGKFTLVPAVLDNHHPKFKPGEYHLSEEWKQRQQQGDIAFRLYWIAFVNEDETPVFELTDRWEEGHKQFAGTVTFPKADADMEDALLWSSLANEMGANPGNWIHDKANSITEPATEFTTARKIAYGKSQEGRGALGADRYQCVFESGGIDPNLARELEKRRQEKSDKRHVDCAPG